MAFTEEQLNEIDSAVQHVVHSTRDPAHQYADFFLRPHEENLVLIKERLTVERARLAQKSLRIQETIELNTAKEQTRQAGMTVALDELT